MLTVVFISCSLLIPLSFVGVMVTREIAQNYLIIESEWPKLVHNFDQAQVDRLLQNNPKLKIFAEHIDFSKLTQGINELAGTLTRFLLEMAQNTFLNITNIALHSLLIVFFMYFFLKDGQVLKKRLQAIIPLNYKDEKAIAIKLKKVTEGIVFNTFLSGFIEGSWGAILFLITGLPSPFFWGVMMVALSIIPLVGANTVLLPAGIILLLTGSVVKGLIILIFGSGLIIVNQNFIKPKFDGKLSGMHPAIVVISSLGGMY
jgi:predicted PurR-regulated permease PerM